MMFTSNAKRALCHFSVSTRSLPLVLLISFSLPPRSVAQGPATSAPTFGSFAGTPDIINDANLNGHWTFPFRHRPGRGTDFVYDMTYDSSVWYKVTSNGTTSWQPVANWGWPGQTQILTGYVLYNTQLGGSCYDSDLRRHYSWYVVVFTYYVDALGVAHNLGPTTLLQTTNTPCPVSYPTSASVLLNDGSGASVSLQSGSISATVYTRNGTTIQPPLNQSTGAGSLTDRNGNQITTDSSGHFYDTLSSATPVLTVAGSGTPSSPMTVTYTAPSGGSASYSVKYGAYSIQTSFGCNGVAEYSLGTVYLVSEIDLPDGLKYSFSYEPTPGHAGWVTGRLASVMLPTGGTINYTYTGGNNGVICSDGSAAGLTRQTPDGTWTYVRTFIGGTQWQTLVTDPLGNQTVIQFQGIYETQRKTYQGSSSSGQLLQTINTCYNGAASPCTGTAITLPITRRTQLVAFPDNTGKVCEHDEFSDSAGRQTEQDDYDYGSGGPASSPMRKVITVYGIVSMPSSITICNGSGTSTACTGPSGSSTGTVVAQTTFCYDEATPSGSTTCGATGSPTAMSGTPQHVAISGSRGNATTVNKLVSGSTYLATKATYYDTGNPQTVTGANTAATTYNYADATSTCGNAFPTSVSEPLSMSRSMTWNCNGGVMTSLTDQNSQVTSTTYDDSYFWRPHVVTDQLGNQTNIYYGGPTLVTPWLKFNNNNSVTSVAHNSDGLGRPAFDQRYQSPTAQTYDTVSYAYDANGRPYSTTMPCSVGYGLNCPGGTPKMTQTYDALNRPLVTTDGGGGMLTNSYSQNDVLVTIGPAPSGEHAKQRQLEYDPLGRLTSVCEITTLTGSGSCGQNTAASGYLTKYTYDALGNLSTVTQNAQPNGTPQPRTYAYDAMSRLTSETNPESGTTTYIYDTDGTCSLTFSGDLVRKTDANGNVICYQYDGLHRLLWVKYVSGPNAANSYAKFFWYDAPYANNTSPTANLKGRLSAAGTCTTPACTVNTHSMTHSEYAYDAKGNITDVWEQTQSFTNVNHITKTYWPNGLLQQLSGVPGLPTIYYGASDGSGLDGEGRITKITTASGPNPIACSTPPCVSYNTAGQVTNLIFGSGDGDSYTYDANTGRMTQYQFNVNGQSVVGTPGWNANGTLASLNVTDPFNSGADQNCTYGYDDLSRLASVNCPSVWSQTFSYDPFGNLTKNGSYWWTSGYNSATNRYTLAGTSYDNNGNLLNDTFHTYQWDAEGNITAVDVGGSNYTDYLTYDASGNMVEYKQTYANGNPAWLAQQVFGVLGSSGTPLGYTTSTGGTNFELPLVGGAKMAGWSGTTVYGHSDWLGSIRLDSTPSRTVTSDAVFAPFGEVYNSPTTYWYEFAGLAERLTGNLWDADARHYHADQGRWISPDPAGLAAVNFSNPQSWNRYSYVRNNPLNRIDTFGMNDCPDDKSTCGDDWSDPGSGAPGVDLFGGFRGCAVWDASCAGVGPDLLGCAWADFWGGDCAAEMHSLDPSGRGQSELLAAEARYASILNTGWDPELRIQYHTYSFAGGCNGTLQCQTQLAAIQFGQQACAGQAPSAVASCIEQVYSQLAQQENPTLVGGNYNFSFANIQINGKTVDPSEWGCFGRCGILDSMHFNFSLGTFHVDTANPWFAPIGSFLHLGVDVIGGNWWWRGGIPRFP